MKTDVFISNPGAAIWQRVIEFDGELSLSAARALLKLRFSERDHALLDELSAKARAGSLTADEQTQLDTFERLGCLLDILHSKARRALKKKPRGRPDPDERRNFNRGTIRTLRGPREAVRNAEMPLVGLEPTTL